ncbi:MAG: HisA/HisF-related TIM barrel protein, partial [Acidimicrobiales bacterium]
MDLFCAIDLRGGQSVRLVQGDFDQERRFGDPLQLAERFVAEGATRLHVVDLDAAKTGAPVNRAVVKAIVERSGVPVQVGGGVRGEDDAGELLAMGADRVVMGTTALTRPEVARATVARFPGRVAFGLDYRCRPGGELVACVSGWTDDGGTVAELLKAWREQPLAAIVVTAIERDGTG